MTDPQPLFSKAALAGARFTDVNLESAVFDDVSLRAAAFTNVALTGARFTDTSFRDATIEGCDVEGLRIDGLLVSDLLRIHRQRSEAGEGGHLPKSGATMQRLIPKIFYANIEDGLDLFVGCLGFAIRHRDSSLVVIERDGAKAYLVEDAVFAAKDRPELAIETDSIDALYADIASERPEMLHPNLRTVTTRPWGAREFAVLDRTQVCVIFRQWQSPAA